MEDNEVEGEDQVAPRILNKVIKPDTAILLEGPKEYMMNFISNMTQD